MKTIGIIGGGNMGFAIIHRIVKRYKVVVSEKDRQRRLSLRRRFKIATPDLKSLLRMSEVIIIAVKPQDIDGVLKEVSELIRADQLLISIAAGIPTGFIERKIQNKVRVIRAMPNMPALIAEGMTAVCRGRYAKKADIHKALEIFNHIGETVVVKEEMIDAVTAVSGSGPAYVFLFAECLMTAAEAVGLSPALSRQLVKKTLVGSAHLLDQQSEDAASLRRKVTSKGGTTQAAMDVFQKNKIEKVFRQAVAAAQKRAKELAKRS